MQEILINILLFCGILLLVALVAAMIWVIVMLIDLSRMTREVRKKFMLLTSVVDVVTLLFSGLGGAKKMIKKKLDPKDSTLVAFVAGVKKGLEVFTKTKEEGGGKNG